MFDSTCKFIAAAFSRDWATWLLGKPIDLTELKPSELSLEPIRADSLIFLQSEDVVLHIEFQTDPKEDIPFRMADYRLRVYRRYPNKEMHQVVIYLRQSGSELVQQTVFELAQTRHQFNVIRLWEVNYADLLTAPGVWPFAVLGQGGDRESVLRDVANRIEQITDKTDQSNLAASTAILAGLRLDKVLIQRILREDIMKESVIYQEIRAEAKEEGFSEGIEQGIDQGKQLEAANLVLRQLNRRLGQISAPVAEQIRQLRVEQLEDLAEALLDFESEADLLEWLAKIIDMAE
jgi:predicted transposase/invertase (TIGR01784 family)